MGVYLLSPNPLSGMGQVVSKYAKLLGGEVIHFDLMKDVDFTDKEVFAFSLPLDNWIETLKKIKLVAKNVVCMTVCETETVHSDYGKLFSLFETILVPSEFCKKVFSRQFRKNNFVVVRHWEPLPPPCPDRTNAKKYVFYHIGNIIDHRKQINHIIRAFEELNLPDAQLVLKATCKNPVNVNIPNVLVMNGLLPEEHLHRIHDVCDCYVSFSNSEGVGMGAVEAALRHKPVIISEYGGAKEYINTEYEIKCNMKTVGVNDFLYCNYMLWGDPDYESLKLYMKDAYDKKLRYVNHDHTRKLLESETIRTQLTEWLSKSIDQQSELKKPDCFVEQSGDSPCRRWVRDQWVVL